MTYNEFFETLKNLNIDKVQITETINKKEEVEYINDIKDRFEIEDAKTYSIKTEQNKKTVKVTTDYLDQEIIDLILFKLKYTESKNEDIYLEDNNNNNEKDELKDTTISDKFETLEKLSLLRNEYKYVDKINTYYQRNSKSQRIINDLGVDIAKSSATKNFYIEVVAKKDDVIKTVSHQEVLTEKEEYDFENIARKTIEKAIISLDEREIPTGKYNVIFENIEMCSMLSKLISGLNAESIQKHTSMYENKLNKKIASNNLTVIEDPTNSNYPGYNLFDQEGTKTYYKEIIKDGILKTYLYDNKTALIDKTKSTGNSYGSIGVSNMYIKPGNNTYEELVKKLNNGIIIADYMASSNAINLNDGTMSIQIIGYKVENGKIVSGIKPCIMTTTIEEFLNNIKEVGNDLVFKNRSSGAVSLLIENMKLSS